MVKRIEAEVHHGFMAPLLRTGRIPSSAEAAERLGVSVDAVHEALEVV